MVNPTRPSIKITGTHLPPSNLKLFKPSFIKDCKKDNNLLGFDNRIITQIRSNSVKSQFKI